MKCLISKYRNGCDFDTPIRDFSSLYNGLEELLQKQVQLGRLGNRSHNDGHPNTCYTEFGSGI